MVQKYCAVAMGLVAALALGACENTTSWKGQQPPKVVDARTGKIEPQGITPAPDGLDRLNMAAGVQSGGQFPPPNDRDLMVMTDKLGGAVQIYDLNSGAPKTYGGVVETGGGMPSSVDSSVMVYPVDGGSEYPAQITQTWPNSVLPLNDMSSVSSFSGARMAGGGGRLSPHVGSGYAPSQIFFKHGSARLGSGDRSVIKQTAEQAKFAPVDRITVEGFASKTTGMSSPVDSKIVNLKQSMDRAFNVSSQLMRSGVPAEKIKTTVWGDTRSTGSEAEDRRVDIVTGAQQ